MPNINLVQTITTATNNQTYFIVSNNGLVRRFKFDNFYEQLQQSIPDVNRTDQNLFTHNDVTFNSVAVSGNNDRSGKLLFSDGTSQVTAYHGFTPSVPASSTSTGSAGQLSCDSEYVYICVAHNAWKRIAASDF